MRKATAQCLLHFKIWRLVLLCVFVIIISYTVESKEQPKMTPLQHHRTVDRVIQHHSFSAPLLRNYYGEDELPHWSFSGSTVITEGYVRLTGEFKGQSGQLWNTEPLDLPVFEIVVGFHIHGSSKGADGFAFWIAKEKPEVGGPLLGRKELFTGVGVLLDTYDNDVRGDNPAIYVLYNKDGESNKKYTPQNDFMKEYLAVCKDNYRQTSKHLSTLRLVYKDNTLNIFISHSGEERELLCATIPDLYLDTGSRQYYIGLTAETGDLSDNHDIYFVHTMPITGVKYDHDVYTTTYGKEEHYGYDDDEKEHYGGGGDYYEKEEYGHYNNHEEQQHQQQQQQEQQHQQQQQQQQQEQQQQHQQQQEKEKEQAQKEVHDNKNNYNDNSYHNGHYEQGQKEKEKVREEHNVHVSVQEKKNEKNLEGDKKQRENVDTHHKQAEQHLNGNEQQKQEKGRSSTTHSDSDRLRELERELEELKRRHHLG